MNTIVNFETAKLLKEKEFDLICHWYFTHKRKFPTSEDTYYPNQTSKPQNWNDDSNLKFYERFSAPTIAEVVMWLYEKHGIWIIVNIAIDDNWYFELYNLKDKRNAEILINDGETHYEHNSPTEAYQEAISYTLKNLI